MKKRISGSYTYMLLCSDGTLYIGSTTDLERRIHEHNNAKSGAHYTKIRRPVTLVWKKAHKSLGNARSHEAQLKKLTRAEKLKLL